MKITARRCVRAGSFRVRRCLLLCVHRNERVKKKFEAACAHMNLLAYKLWPLDGCLIREQLGQAVHMIHIVANQLSKHAAANKGAREHVVLHVPLPHNCSCAASGPAIVDGAPDKCACIHHYHCMVICAPTSGT